MCSIQQVRKPVFLWLVYLLVLLFPLSVYFPLRNPLAEGVVPIYVTPAVYLVDLALLGVIIAGVSKNAVASGKRSFLTVFLLLVILLGVLSISPAISPSLAGYTVVRWLLALGLYWALTQNRVSLPKVVFVFLLGLGVHTLIGLGQFWLHGPLGIPGELALDVETRGAAIISVAGTRWLRIYGMTFHPNMLGGFLAVGLILGLPLVARRWLRVLWWLLCVGLLLTFSRAAWLAAGLVLPILAVWLAWRFAALRRPLAITLGTVALAGIAGLVLLWGPISARLLPSQTRSEMASLSGRGELIALALDSVSQHPLRGVGAGNFPLLVLETKTPTFPHYVHNVPLLLAAEIGVLGGLLWYLLWLYPLWRLDRFWRGERYWPVVLIGAWFAFGLIALWDSYPWALEGGRLLSVILLAWINQSILGPESNTDE